eukprot:6176628-Pleurochrysis_carterae.AAC.1
MTARARPHTACRQSGLSVATSLGSFIIGLQLSTALPAALSLVTFLLGRLLQSIVLQPPSTCALRYIVGCSLSYRAFPAFVDAAISSLSPLFTPEALLSPSTVRHTQQAFAPFYGLPACCLRFLRCARSGWPLCSLLLCCFAVNRACRQSFAERPQMRALDGHTTQELAA